MRVNSISNTSFRAVTPIIMEKGEIDDVARILEKRAKNCYWLQDATRLYEHPYGPGDDRGVMRKAVEKGKEVGFLVTGKDYADMICARDTWYSEYGPSKHINRKPIRMTPKSTGAIETLLNRINKFL